MQCDPDGVQRRVLDDPVRDVVEVTAMPRRGRCGRRVGHDLIEPCLEPLDRRIVPMACSKVAANCGHELVRRRGCGHVVGYLVEVRTDIVPCARCGASGRMGDDGGDEGAPMSAALDIDRYLEVLQTSGARFVASARRAGEATKVPTCPSWKVRALVAHQAMVHRWATATVLGDDRSALLSQTEIRKNVDDLEQYFAAGVAGLVDALRAAPEDLVVETFLRDPPSPRVFWARRQAHETTVHAVDAQSAELGRAPTAAEAGIDLDVAVDGIDELLTGFFTP